MRTRDTSTYHDASVIHGGFERLQTLKMSLGSVRPSAAHVASRSLALRAEGQQGRLFRPRQRTKLEIGEGEGEHECKAVDEHLLGHIRLVQVVDAHS